MSGRRTSLTTTSRRRSSGVAPRLGAVKLQSPLGAGAGSDAGSPMSGSEPSSALATPQEQSPLVAAARSTAANIDSGHISTAAVDGVKQFSRKLSADRSADKWLEEQSTASAAAAKGAPQRQRPLASASQQQHKAAAVETAASQIVHKALGFITADAPRRASAPAVAGTGTAAGAVAARKASSNFDSSSFLDKGMDAISGVGRLMEGFVSQLDTVIGQAFEDWGTNPRPGAKPLPRRPLAASAAVAGKENAGVPAAAAVPAAAGVAGAAAKPRQEQQVPPQQQQQQGGASNSGSRQPHITSFMSKLDAASEQEAVEWRKRAQQMAQELQRMRAQQEEYQRLRLQYEKLQTDLQQTSTQASRLAQENSTLKSRGLPPGADPSLADPMAEQQVARQMEALLTEKSKLVAENDRLLRENTGLQELLEFSLAHQSQLTADGDLFGYGDDECGDATMQTVALFGNQGTKLLKGKGTTKPAAKTAAKPAVKKAAPAKKSSGTERSGGAGYRQYDGDALWLPNTTRPAWLDGSLPGDRGFDPLGLSRPVEYLQVDVDELDQNAAVNKPGGIVGAFTPVADQVSTDSLQPYSEVFGLQRFRECELIHGRWAMLACLGALVQEATTGDSWVAAQTIVYDQPQYAGVELPFSIYTLAILNSVLMGGVELFRNTELDPERRCYPGGFFDPLKLASDDSERTDKLREAEIKHARLAMVSFLGYTVQAWSTGEGALGSLQKFSNGF